MEKRKRTLYMRVTEDEFELPIAVARSKQELARMVGTSTATIYRGFSANKKGFVKIDVELEEGEEI